MCSINQRSTYGQLKAASTVLDQQLATRSHIYTTQSVWSAYKVTYIHHTVIMECLQGHMYTPHSQYGVLTRSHIYTTQSLWSAYKVTCIHHTVSMECLQGHIYTPHSHYGVLKSSSVLVGHECKNYPCIIEIFKP